mgnify:CR=1 FL=1
MKKNVIDDVVEREMARNRREREKIELLLSDYPKGSLLIRENRGKRYCYLKFRKGKKVITKYVCAESMINELREVMVERDKLIETINNLDTEYARLVKIKNVK